MKTSPIFAVKSFTVLIPEKNYCKKFNIYIFFLFQFYFILIIFYTEMYFKINLQTFSFRLLISNEFKMLTRVGFVNQNTIRGYDAVNYRYGNTV